MIISFLLFDAKKNSKFWTYSRENKYQEKRDQENKLFKFLNRKLQNILLSLSSSA